MSNLYALLIGVDFYFPNRTPEGSYSHLGGCVRDVNHVEGFLTHWMNVPSQNLIKLSASYNRGGKPPEPASLWPTYENIVNAFKRISEMARAGDQVYIHYSGHGGRAKTIYPEIKGAAGLDEGLVPTNIGDPKSRYVRDIELAYLLKAMVDKNINLTVVLDSCHSGGSTRAVDDPTSGGPAIRGFTAIDPRYDYDSTPRPTDSLVASRAELLAAWQASTTTRAVNPDANWLLEPQGYTLLAACRANEFAYEDNFSGTERNGALTYWLLDSLRQLGATSSYKVLFDRVLAKIRTRFVVQTPQLQGIGDRRFFSSETIKPYYAITVTQVDATQQQINLNAGEVHGLKVGTPLAIYPPGTSDFSATGPRQALAELTQVDAVDSFARVTKKLSDAVIEQGAQAIALATLDLRLQRGVKLSITDSTVREALNQAIQTRGAGFVKTVKESGKDRVDFQVAVNAKNEYEIQDQTGNPLPNLRPAIRIDEADATQRVADRLLHLTKYRNVQALENPDPSMARKLRVELLDTNQRSQTVFRPKEVAILRIYNDLQPNPGNPNDPTRILNVTVLYLQSDWSVIQLIPKNAGDSELIQPGQFIERKLGTYLADGYTENTDSFKVFATQQTSSFHWLTLPALDQPIVVVSGKRKGDSTLDQLLAALGGEKAERSNITRTRAVRLMEEAAERPWAVGQVELRVKKG